MLTKYGISPWHDGLQESFPLQPKEISIVKTQPLKSQENKIFITQDKILKSNKSNKNRKNKQLLIKFKQLKKNHTKFITDPDWTHQNIRMSIDMSRKTSKKVSSHLITYQSKAQPYINSQRTPEILNHSFSLHERVTEQKRSLNQTNKRNLPYFFSLVDKQNFKQNKIREPSQQREEDIFKRVDQILIKKKKEIRLPKISVGYSRNSS